MIENPFQCGHCRKDFARAFPQTYMDHVKGCLESHIAELQAHGLVTRGDDIYPARSVTGGQYRAKAPAWDERWGFAP